MARAKKVSCPDHPDIPRGGAAEHRGFESIAPSMTPILRVLVVPAFPFVVSGPVRR
jgi:nitrate reductase NapE component